MMNERASRFQIMSGFFWKFMERIAAQGISFLVTLVLARLLTADDYGVVALLTVFISLANVMIDSGLSNALIQKKDADNVDFSTVFVFNIVLTLGLYGLMFCAAPLIAGYYQIPQLEIYLRVLGITLILGGINNVQRAMVQKRMQFKRFFVSTIGGTLISAVVGIVMALKGMGAWALIAQILTNQVIDTTILWFTVRWRPTSKVSLKRLSPLFRYGWKILFSSYLDAIYNSINNLIIGKRFGSAQLGSYDRGQKIPNLIIVNVNVSIQNVLFPVLSESQNETDRMKKITKKAIQVSSYIIFPLMVGLALTAEPLIALVLTEKWLIAVPFLQIFCISYAFWPIHTANLQAVQALGRSDLFLKLEFIKKAVGIILLLIGLKFGVIGLAVSNMLLSLISVFINSYPNKKLINYGAKEQLSDIKESVLLCFIMGVGVYLIGRLELNYLSCLTLQILCGLALYFGGSVILKNSVLKYIVNTVKSIKKGGAGNE